MSDYAKTLDLPQAILSVLVQTFGEERVDFYPQGMYEESSQPFFTSLTEAISFLFHPSGSFAHFDASNNGTYIQWNLKSSHWAQLVTLFSHDKRWSSGLFPALPHAFEDPWMQDRACFGISTDIADKFLVRAILHIFLCAAEHINQSSVIFRIASLSSSSAVHSLANDVDRREGLGYVSAQGYAAHLILAGSVRGAEDLAPVRPVGRAIHVQGWGC